MSFDLTGNAQMAEDSGSMSRLYSERSHFMLRPKLVHILANFIHSHRLWTSSSCISHHTTGIVCQCYTTWQMHLKSHSTSFGGKSVDRAKVGACLHLDCCRAVPFALRGTQKSLESCVLVMTHTGGFLQQALCEAHFQFHCKCFSKTEGRVYLSAFARFGCATITGVYSLFFLMI